MACFALSSDTSVARSSLEFRVSFHACCNNRGTTHTRAVHGLGSRILIGPIVFNRDWGGLARARPSFGRPLVESFDEFDLVRHGVAVERPCLRRLLPSTPAAGGAVGDSGPGRWHGATPRPTQPHDDAKVRSVRPYCCGGRHSDCWAVLTFSRSTEGDGTANDSWTVLFGFASHRAPAATNYHRSTAAACCLLPRTCQTAVSNAYHVLAITCSSRALRYVLPNPYFQRSGRVTTYCRARREVLFFLKRNRNRTYCCTQSLIDYVMSSTEEHIQHSSKTSKLRTAAICSTTRTAVPVLALLLLSFSSAPYRYGSARRRRMRGVTQLTYKHRLTHPAGRSSTEERIHLTGDWYALGTDGTRWCPSTCYFVVFIRSICCRFSSPVCRCAVACVAAIWI